MVVIGVIYEPYLEPSDFADIDIEFRRLWSTRRLALNYPIATILRYTEYPNPQALSTITITHSRLNITENIIGRSVNLVEGSLDQSYMVTGYTTTTITVVGADFIGDGFTTSCTFHIDALKYQKMESPTKTQVIAIGTESLLDREVAYYNLTEVEIKQFNNELDMFDRRFVFYDIGEAENNDVIVSDGQNYVVYKQKYNITYNKVSIYGKAIRRT